MFKWSKKQIIYLLFAYILLQFLWWEVLLVKLHHQNIEKEKQLQALKITSAEQFRQIEKQYNKEQRIKIIMIVGEGTVFLILLLFAFYNLLKSYEREIVMNERQNHFLLSLPHEIKTPLSIIQLNLQTTLQNTSLSSEQRNNLTKKSLEELKRLQNLIEQLLLSNRIGKDKYSICKEKINLSDELKKWIYPYSEEKNIYQSIEEHIYIEVDKQLIQLMIQNLLSNAVKFSDNFISVNLYSKGKNYHLEISNDGDIIPDEEKEKIFELFYRSPRVENKGIKGTGLGLYIVKQIADLHSIKIRVITKNQHNVFQVVF